MTRGPALTVRARKSVKISAIMRNMQLVAAGANQSYEGWLRLERSLSETLREVRCERNPHGFSLVVFALLMTVAITVWMVNELFRGGPETLCRRAADSNRDRVYNISDAIFVASYRFLGGLPPPTPFPSCGFDSDSPFQCAPGTVAAGP